MEKKTNVEIMKGILPSDYVCEERKDGVHCYSSIGIEDRTDSEWNGIFGQIKKQFGNKFSEVFHQTCARHKRFTVYLKSTAKNITWLNQPQLRVK